MEDDTQNSNYGLPLKNKYGIENLHSGNLTQCCREGINKSSLLLFSLLHTYSSFTTLCMLLCHSLLMSSRQTRHDFRTKSCRRTKKMMMVVKHSSAVLIFLIIISLVCGISESARVFTIINDCKMTIWPAVTPGESFNGGGFALKPGQSMVFTAPVGWSGRIWGRTGCKFDQAGTGKCETGSCGDALKCGASGKTPATLAEFTLAKLDYYDVSLVDGFNLPMAVKPVHGVGNCTTAGCDHDLRTFCPNELTVKIGGKTVGCRSACDVFNTDEYCCRGTFGNPVTCQPTFYSKKFKEACPTAYSYAYDDPTSIFTCSGTDYVITFCSSRSQPVCTYHDDKLHCSDSSAWKHFSTKWWIAVLIAASVMNCPMFL